MLIQKIAEARKLKEATIWQHLAELIQHNQLSIQKVLSKNKIKLIKPAITSEKDTLKEIKQRLSNNKITYNEINCILASIKPKKS